MASKTTRRMALGSYERYGVYGVNYSPSKKFSSCFHAFLRFIFSYSESFFVVFFPSFHFVGGILRSVKTIPVFFFLSVRLFLRSNLFLLRCPATRATKTSTRTGPCLPHVLLLANMCSPPGNIASRTRHMRSFFPAANRLRLCHTKRGHMFSNFCSSATAW